MVVMHQKANYQAFLSFSQQSASKSISSYNATPKTQEKESIRYRTLNDMKREQVQSRRRTNKCSTCRKGK